MSIIVFIFTVALIVATLYVIGYKTDRTKLMLPLEIMVFSIMTLFDAIIWAPKKLIYRDLDRRCVQPKNIQEVWRHKGSELYLTGTARWLWIKREKKSDPVHILRIRNTDVWYVVGDSHAENMLRNDQNQIFFDHEGAKEVARQTMLGVKRTVIAEEYSESAAYQAYWSICPQPFGNVMSGLRAFTLIWPGNPNQRQWSISVPSVIPGCAQIAHKRGGQLTAQMSDGKWHVHSPVDEVLPEQLREKLNDIIASAERGYYQPEVGAKISTKP